MKTKFTLLCVVMLSGLFLSSQPLPKDTYWVKLKDKNGSAYQISQPATFLSQRAIDRRLRQQIPIEETDLPVSAVYLDSLKKLGFEIVHTSKWLNGATVRTNDTTLIPRLEALTFVSLVEHTKPGITLKSYKSKFIEEKLVGYPSTHYGKAYKQLSQLNGQYLHDKGFRGKGIHVALLDAGFWQVNNSYAFDSLRNSGRLLGIRDFVNPQSDIYQQHSHGMSVLSTMAANIPGTLVGTAPDASYYLFRTEDDASEYKIEEDNWVAAAELADSVGVDIINASLGYNIFDDSTMNHSFADLDGKTTRITQGANMAFKKGILVFASAGNEGNKSWQRIVVPSDGENVIAVAAVDSLGNRAAFSSLGPAYGGAIKPNVAARGRLTYLLVGESTPGFSSGTSFSSPVLAGMGACLLQANPQATVVQIKKAIEQSGSIYLKPDSLIGYGIPDFEKADIVLKSMGVGSIDSSNGWNVSPNPFTNHLVIKNIENQVSGKSEIKIYNLEGVCLWQKNYINSGTFVLNNLIDLPDGLLVLRIKSGDKEARFKLIKSGR